MQFYQISLNTRVSNVDETADLGDTYPSDVDIFTFICIYDNIPCFNRLNNFKIAFLLSYMMKYYI